MNRQTHILSISSGKGGVGKSNLVVNLAIQLARRKRKVLVLDADMGLANIDILVGKVFPTNLAHVFEGKCSLEEAIHPGPEGIDILPAASGVEWMTDLAPEQRMALVQKMDALNGRYDILLVDTGAGISTNVVYFNVAARTRVLVVTPEPTSLTDAYAVIKVLHNNHGQKRFEIVVNQVADEKAARDVYRNLTGVADRFLNVEIGFLGFTRRDPTLEQAVRRRSPAVVLAPDSPIARDYDAVAARIALMREGKENGDLGMFWRNVAGSTAGTS